MVYIYKLKIAGKSYVGSTKHIRHRMNCHKSECYNQNSKIYKYKFIRENGGWDNVEIHILQECNEDVRFDVEDFYIKHYNCELNEIGAVFDLQYHKKYYQKNKQRKIKYHKEYYEKNKEKKKEYRENNKEKRKEYVKNNKEKLNEKFNCNCGGKYMRGNKKAHERTKKHKNYLASLSSSSSLASFQSAGLK